MKALHSYRLRLKRKKWKLRAIRRAMDLRAVANRTRAVAPDAILVAATVRNEIVRLPWFLDYYRRLGAGHFLIVDNGSDDGTRDYLAEQPDVSLWSTSASYKAAHFGIDWINWILRRHAHGHWVLTVDPDEVFVYPFCDTRPLQALTHWLDASRVRSFPAMLVDMYPRGPIDTHPYFPGQDPLDVACWYDSGNYTISRNPEYVNLWIQGGVRARVFFPDEPSRAPALNKIPLVRWNSRYTYISSTHALLPRGLNLVYDEWGGEKAAGCLLHVKFLGELIDKAREEEIRREHYGGSVEYRAYLERLSVAPDLWSRWSERYEGWRQLEAQGLMSRGNWA